MDLFGRRDVVRRESALRTRWEAFHEDNPRIYEEVRRLALWYVRVHKRRRLGFKLLWEEVRANSPIEVWRDGTFLLNNNFIPFYSRLLMEREHELRGIFETRKGRHV
jgi:hypothetical protein